MSSFLFLFFFLLFPAVVIYLLVVFSQNYNKLTSSDGDKEERIKATNKVRVIMLESVVHELGNCATSLLPLFENVRFTIEQQEYTLENKNKLNFDLDIINEQLNRIVETKYDASVFSQLVGDESQYVNVNECIRSCWRVSRHDKRAAGVDIKMILSNELGIIKISPSSLMSIVINLFSNSFDALYDVKENRSISIETFMTSTKIVLVFSDTGVGMSEEIVRQVKQPFYTTKEKGKGTGLGLHVIQEIMNSAKGKLEIESRENQGTTVSLYFPLTQ